MEKYLNTEYSKAELKDYFDRALKLEADAGLEVIHIDRRAPGEYTFCPAEIRELEDNVARTKNSFCSKCVNKDSNNAYVDICACCLSNWIKSKGCNDYCEPMYFRTIADVGGTYRKGKKIFISGPMRGYEDYNTPMFDACEKALREAGYDVFNPAWLKVGEDWSREDILAIDLQALNLCDGICQLPDWSKAEGARLEFEYFCAWTKDKLWLKFDGEKVYKAC